MSKANLIVDISIVDKVDKSLSSGRFGNGESLAHNIRTLYAGMQRIVDASIGSNIAAVMSSSSPAAQVIIRGTLDEAFVLLTSNPDAAKQKVAELEQYFTSLTGSQNGSDTHSFPVQDLQPLSNWPSSDFHQAIAYRLKDAIAREGFVGEIKVIEPTESHRQAIEEAKVLLDQLTPRVASSTLPLVRCLAIINATFESAYVNKTPFMFMVNVARLADPLLAADTILHEALHQKMADIRLTRQLLLEGYDDLASKASRDISIPWGASSPRPFSVARALATYHVYVHSTLLHAVALEHLPNNTVLRNIGSEEISRRLLCAFERASYLEERLGSDVALEKMGRDGRQFMVWMSSALAQLQEVCFLDGTRF